MLRRSRTPIWQPNRFSRFTGFLASAVNQITFNRAAVILLLFFVSFYIHRELNRDVLIIDPFSVPKQFDEVGLTPDVIANRIRDAMHQIEAGARTSMKKDSLASLREMGSTPNVEIPGTGLGVKTVIEVAREVLGKYPKHVGGDIVLEKTESIPNNATVTVYITHGRDRNRLGTVKVAAGDTDALTFQTAEMILSNVNPYVLAVHKYDKGDVKEATHLLEEILKDPTRDHKEIARALNFVATMFDEQKQYDKAADTYQRAVEQDPDFALSYFNWGTMLVVQNKCEEALPKLQKAAELDRTDPGAYQVWADALIGLQKYDQAATLLHKSLVLDPGYAPAYNAWGNLFYSQTRYDDAVSEYRKAIALDSKYAYAYANLGNVLHVLSLLKTADVQDSQAKRNEAVDCYRKAVELDPKYAPAYYQLGNVLYEQSKYDEAIGNYQKAVDVEPKLTDAHYQWASVLFSQKKYDQAAAKYRETIEMNPQFAPAYNDWGNILFNQRKYDEAIAKYRKAAELDPHLSVAYSNWGAALQLQGKHVEAEEVLAKVPRESQPSPE